MMNHDTLTNTLHDALMEEDAQDEARDVFEVGGEHEGERLDKYLSDVTGLTRSAVVRLMDDGCVRVETLQGGAWKPITAGKNVKIKSGSRVTVTYPMVEDSETLPEDIPLDIVYEDSDILVVNKPVGMVVHPAPGNPTGTLVNALLYHCGDSLSGIGGVRRPGIVHRIDKDTSGLLVVAKHDTAHRGLSEQLKTHTVSRIYHAICVGNIKEDRGTVDLCIGRNPTDRKKMATYPKGASALSGGVTVREAVTHYTVMERYPLGHKWGQSFTYVRCQLETGRTHQIRVHMASSGHPLLGDSLYGGDGTRFGKSVQHLLCGQCLHAKELSLIHPMTGEKMHFECPLPDYFGVLLQKLTEEASL